MSSDITFQTRGWKNATVHCMTVGVKPKNFKWVVNDKVIFKSETPTMMERYFNQSRAKLNAQVKIKYN